MKLPTLDEAPIEGKRVLVRADLDIDPSSGASIKRLQVLFPTLSYLFDKGCSVVLIGHRGRPKGEDPSLSMEAVGGKLEEFLREKLGEERLNQINLNLMENLRFNEGEEVNSEDYAKHIAEDGEVFVNDAFAASHRKHASIVALPRLLPHFAGRRFVEEVENLQKARDNPRRPVVVIIGGVKEDKLAYIAPFKQFADRILVGGRLPLFMEEGLEDKKTMLAYLNVDKFDITASSIEKFEKEIEQAGTIVLAGPMGKFEEKGHDLGTRRVFKAVAVSSAYKIVGGGDTQEALEAFGLEEKMDWVSVGGGASLEFLAHGTLPGIEALLN